MALDPRRQVTLRCEVPVRCFNTEKLHLMDFDEVVENPNAIPGIFNYKFIGAGLGNKKYHIKFRDSITDYQLLTQENFAEMCNLLRDRTDIRFTAYPRGFKGGKYVKEAQVDILREPATRQDNFNAARTVLEDVNIAGLVQAMAHFAVNDQADDFVYGIRAIIDTIAENANNLAAQLDADNAAQTGR
ncbi:hypothetical protein SDRG_11279 [Saprolegnia diclina VS20]|uniref:Uncharacterized protein n=1 Tax=Saprolegnia diclina (strain VS20) TaxID=1156394 RepID=T0PZU0_SAPDV|nr:hypothetical protein SDRG_11279 [Saprolegnia diclina VS20]EQC31094.1 hypothetical protein SDRG_11279 [Saprolegnia diclina VS20]|eukprot:XP_008615533.1 hypothetical protein SDRG_11279 [Saprolegnia diclina VS20]